MNFKDKMKEWKFNLKYNKPPTFKSRNDIKLSTQTKLTSLLTNSLLPGYSSKNKVLGYYTSTNSIINLKRDPLRYSTFAPETDYKKRTQQRIKTFNIETELNIMNIDKPKLTKFKSFGKQSTITLNQIPRSRNITPISTVNKIQIENRFTKRKDNFTINSHYKTNTELNKENSNNSNLSSSLDGSVSIYEKKNDVNANKQLSDFMSPRSIKELKELNDKLVIKPQEKKKFTIYPSNNIKYKFDSKFKLVLESIKRK